MHNIHTHIHSGFSLGRWVSLATRGSLTAWFDRHAVTANIGLNQLVCEMITLQSLLMNVSMVKCNAEMKRDEHEECKHGPVNRGVTPNSGPWVQGFTAGPPWTFFIDWGGFTHLDRPNGPFGHGPPISKYLVPGTPQEQNLSYKCSLKKYIYSKICTHFHNVSKKIADLQARYSVPRCELVYLLFFNS